MDTKFSTNGKFHHLPIEAVAFEALNAMEDQALVEVYRLLVRLEQHDAAALLAEFARRIAEIDVSSDQEQDAGVE